MRNNAADEQADLANMTRPNFFTRMWNRFQRYRADWKHRVKLMTSFHLGVAAQDCTGETQNIHEDDQEFEVSHFDFVTSQNTAEVSIHLSAWLETGVFRSSWQRTVFLDSSVTGSTLSMRVPLR